MPKLLLSFGLLLVAIASQAQVIYVDADAGGTNDGSSWANAYTDLSVAIDSAEAGSDLWIAAGTYVTPETSPFFIDRELSLYGGFAGTETSAGEADPSTNVTVLSGDVSGNDVVGSYDSLLAVDNNRVLVIIDTNETSQFTVTIDGLTISHGVIAPNFPGSVPLFPYAGGGIYSEAKTMVSRVTFSDNRAPFGSAAAYIFTTASGSTFDDISLINNPTSVANAMYFNLADSISIRNSSFTEGTTSMETGMIFAANLTGLTIQNSIFDTISIAGSAAALETANVLDIDVRGSEFTDLSAGGFGGAMYIFNDPNFMSDREIDPTELTIDNCSFTNNSSAGRGGSLALFNLSNTVSNSSFVDGVGQLGGAIYYVTFDTLEYRQVVTNNLFNRNVGATGGAICYLTDYADLDIIGNTFTANIDDTEFGGGAIYLQATPDLDRNARLENNIFRGNQSLNGPGAALRIRRINSVLRGNSFSGNLGQDGTAEFDGAGVSTRIVSSSFIDNGNAENPFFRGAGIALFYNEVDQPTSLVVDSCTFRNNYTVNQSQRLSGGSGIYLEAVADSTFTLSVLNSRFEGNRVVGAAGGAVRVIENVDLIVDNCDFFSNFSSSGGAIDATRYLVRDTLGDVIEPRRYDSLIAPSLDLGRSIFVNNGAQPATDRDFSQGGAINLGDFSLRSTNSLFVNNRVQSGGSGGAIIINGSSARNSVLDNYLINNTFFNNSDGNRPENAADSIPGSVGNAVAIFQPGNTDPLVNAVTLTIQNNALFMEATDEESIGLERNVGYLEDPTGFGEISLISLGGNYFNSTSDVAAEFTDDEADILDVNADLESIFIDPFEADRASEFPNLGLAGDASTNPLVDAGTTGPLVPEVDLYGTERDDMPDIGALELGSIAPVGIAEPIEESGLSFEFYPNPAVDALNIINNDAGVRDFTVLLSDAQGRLISGQQYSAERNTLQVSRLPAGVYHLTLIVNDKLYSKQFLKR
ncbi:putative secreted protein (Por secretion system target) [Neolewinella xylanilytica]|uniref:Putative secreted protein (Por secretion system target) n=1 Tax=Neolewinella xylanilytica TaxID=1514080 RepID=A0A2S6I1A8_9BACT|nr:T9SS type A sorting domain-containing protein [Neolewinella xylanilytica]PPK84725.1 putative secreted protein (Por secretion system target) [Neolewinella xylanilytica]